MRRGIPGLFAALLAALAPALALAHPHVTVEARAEILYDGQGNFIAIRHSWKFDEMYSAFASAGLAKDTDGKTSAEALAELAKVNIESLEEFGYFTVAKIGGKKALFSEPREYRVEDDGKLLTLHLVLPLKQPVPGKTVALEIFDPSYYVAFEFAKGEAVKLEGAPQGCKLTVRRPNDGVASRARTLGETFAQALGAQPDMAQQIENRVLVACP